MKHEGNFFHAYCRSGTKQLNIIRAQRNTECSMDTAGVSCAVDRKELNRKKHYQRLFIVIPKSYFCDPTEVVEKDLKDWILFLKFCGFHFEYHGCKNVRDFINVDKLDIKESVVIAENRSDGDDDEYDDDDYVVSSTNFDNDYYIVSCDQNSHVNYKHGLAYMMVIRYFFSDRYRVCREKAIEMYNTYPVSPFQALLLGNLYTSWDGYYSLMCNDFPGKEAFFKEVGYTAFETLIAKNHTDINGSVREMIKGEHFNRAQVNSSVIDAKIKTLFQ
jgi:hypothetical protein